MHRSVKSFNPKTWLLEARDGMPEKMNETIKCFIQVGVLWRSSFLSEALRLPKKHVLWRTPFLKSIHQVGVHVTFSSMYKVLHQRTSVNHHRTRVLLSTNQILKFP